MNATDTDTQHRRKRASPLAPLIGLNAEEIREWKTGPGPHANEAYVEYETDKDRILALEARTQRLKKGLNEAIAFANSLEKRIEKLEK